jgi:hypothetical protein
VRVPTFEELESLDLGGLNCDVIGCDRRARSLVVWACHVRVVCGRCAGEIAGRAWPEVATQFEYKKPPIYSESSTRPRRPRARSSLSVVN